MSHRTVREPTNEERDQLKRMKRQEVGRVAMRAHMVLLSDRGHSSSEISDLHAVSHPTVYKWIDRFDEKGPGGLYDREREERPPEIDEEAREQIERLLEGNPTEEGQNATRWTAPRIAEHLERELGVDACEDTVRGALKEMEYSPARPRRKLPPTDPEAYRERLEAIVEAVAEAGRPGNLRTCRRRDLDQTQDNTLSTAAASAVAASWGAAPRLGSRGKRGGGPVRNARFNPRRDLCGGLREGPVRLHNRVP